jgi:hypothetical protein
VLAAASDNFEPSGFLIDVTPRDPLLAPKGLFL